MLRELLDVARRGPAVTINLIAIGLTAWLALSATVTLGKLAQAASKQASAIESIVAVHEQQLKLERLICDRLSRGVVERAECRQ